MASGLLVTLLMLLLGACSLGQIAGNKNGVGEYVWTGCHVVVATPPKGSHAFYPLGDLSVGDKFYFKQVGLDGTVGPVTTGKPCQTAASLCGTKAKMTEKLAIDHQEYRVLTGRLESGLMLEMLVSRGSLGWTILVTSPSGIACLFASGTEFSTGGDDTAVPGKKLPGVTM